MQHFYIKEKVSPQVSPPSPKAFAIAILSILLITGYFTAKTFIKNQNRQNSEKNQTQDEISTSGIAYAPELFPVENVPQIMNNSDYQLIDIRNEESWRKKHIENSTNIPAFQLDRGLFIINKEKTILVISQTIDDQAKAAGAKLKENGFKVKLMDGGFEKYYYENHPVISEGDPQSISDKSKTNPVSTHELLEKINQGQRFVFLDTRPKTDYDNSRIEGAINIPLEEIEYKKSELPVGKIVICDENPLRSFQAAVKLYDMNIWTAYYLSDSLSNLKNEIKSAAQPGPIK